MVGPRTPISPISDTISLWNTETKTQTSCHRMSGQRSYMWQHCSTYYIQECYQECLLSIRVSEAEWNKSSHGLRSPGLTLVSVCHDDARHEFLLAVGVEGVSDHDLILRQLALQVQGIEPVELDLCCQEVETLKKKKHLNHCSKYVLLRASYSKYY